jgi:hypothetical protein
MRPDDGDSRSCAKLYKARSRGVDQGWMSGNPLRSNMAISKKPPRGPGVIPVPVRLVGAGDNDVVTAGKPDGYRG